MLPIKHYIRYNLTPKCPLDLIAKARFFQNSRGQGNNTHILNDYG